MTINDGFRIHYFRYGELGHRATEYNKTCSHPGRNLLIEKPMDKTNHAYNDGSNNDGEILLGDRGTTFVIKKSC